MTTSECALCDVEITEQNDSREHIIPNAIGGKKKVKGFICGPCNNKTGDNWESDLARQLNPLSLFFGINRERGNVPSQTFQTTGGNKLKLNAEGSMDIPKPVYEETVLDTGVNINISARSMKEAKSMLKGVKKKYPQVDLDELIANAQVKTSYCPDMLQYNLCFGGQQAGRSIVKSALAMAVDSGVDPKACEHAREYLLNDDGESCFGYYYENDLVSNRPEGVPLHCVYVKGNPSTKQLLAYVEIYGVQRVVMCLSSSYNGEPFVSSYAINPVEGTELDLLVDLTLSPEDILAAYSYEKIPEGSIESAFGKVISTGMAASVEKEKNRVIEQAVQHAFSNCGAKEGEVLLPEHRDKLTSLMMEKLEPFLLHQLSKARKPS